MAPAFRFLSRAFLLSALFSHCFAAELKPLLDRDDLPPYPLPGSPSGLTHSQKETEQIVGGIDTTPESTASEEQSLAQAVSDLKRQVQTAVEKAYRADPALWLSDTYQENAHEWVMSRHNDEFNASLTFLRSMTKETQAIVNRAVDLIDMLLFKELASDPKFLPLFASVYDAADQMAKTNKNILQHFYAYTRKR